MTTHLLPGLSIPALAGAHLQPAAVPDSPLSDTQQQRLRLVLADLLQAQVALYCDHPHEAVLCIRHAVALLDAALDAPGAAELPALAHAAWQIRHHDDSAAAATLGAMRTRLMPASRTAA